MFMSSEDIRGTSAAPPGNPALCVRLEGVSKRFGTVAAVRDVSLAIEAGEFVTLLGPSGCGKTTLLNLLAGHIEADAGAIHIADEPMTNVPPHAREIGMVFQNYALFPHMTVAKNVAYGLRMRGVAKGEMARRVEAVLAMVELAGLEDRRPGALSGGQQQRVALARALVFNPKVLLLDEPFSALDKNLRGAMQIELKALQRRLGITAIFVTHDQGEALSLSDRIAVLSDGAIRQIGTPEDVYRRPIDRFVASFIGDVSTLRGVVETVDAGQVVTRLGAVRVTGARAGFPNAMPGSAADVCIRPEDLRLAMDDEAAAASGTVAARIFQGGYADIVVETPAAPSGRIVMRRPVTEAAADLLPGAPVNIAIAAGQVAVFPPEG